SCDCTQVADLVGELDNLSPWALGGCGFYLFVLPRSFGKAFVVCDLFHECSNVGNRSPLGGAHGHQRSQLLTLRGTDFIWGRDVIAARLSHFSRAGKGQPTSMAHSSNLLS